MEPKQVPETLAKVLLEEIGVKPPNSTYLVRKAARLLISPRFYGSKITIRELITAYVNLCAQEFKDTE